LADEVNEVTELEPTPEPMSPESGPDRRSGWRGVWVTRWDYRSAGEVCEIVENAAGAGFDRVLLQVRGSSDAFHASGIEPRAEELRGTDFDPLAVALEEAKRCGVEVHAWVNVVPSWYGTVPPRDPAHVYHAHPEWHWYDQHGERAPLVEDFYVSLNPCLPEVRDHLVRVVRELSAGYAIDGLHLDYIRFPNEPPVVPHGSGLDYPRDARTLELFAAHADATPDEAPEAWDRWRSDQVTELVSALRRAATQERPGLVLSAAVGADPAHARAHHQDVPTWIARGLLDAVLPMNYASRPATFDACLAHWKACPLQTVMGVRADLGEPEERVRQLQAALDTFGNVNVFAYASLWDSRNEALAEQTLAARAERAKLRARYLPALRVPT
jgi:uncharacterized lipoprotein YddW (UPF0748 family)